MVNMGSEVPECAMDEEINEDEETPKAKLMERTVLDSFSKLTSDVEKIRINAGITILKHLTVHQDTVEVTAEQKYALNRIIRGIGSSRTAAKTGFYSIFVALLSNSTITVGHVLEAVKTHLNTSGSNNKSENADISMGQILVCGGLIHSGEFMNASSEDQNQILEIITTAGKKRSYLSLAAYVFLIELLEKVDEELFGSVLWPFMKKELSKPWSEQTLDTIYFLCLAYDKYPAIVKSKFFKKALETPQIVHEDSAQPLCELLLNVPMTATIKHPIYLYMGKKISESDFVSTWCSQMDQQLMKPTRNKQLISTLFLTSIIQNVNDNSIIPDLFTDQYMKISLCTFNNSKLKDKHDDDFVYRMDLLFEALHKRLIKEDVVNKTKIAVIKKLLIKPGNFSFEKITRSKIIHHITLSLNKDGVEKLAKIYRNVIINKSKEENVRWINTDRMYAAQLLVKLLGHSAVLNEKDWRLEQLIYLLKLGLFKEEESKIGVALAASLKEYFYRGLDQKFPKLEDLRSILSSLVHYINTNLSNDSMHLITPLSEEDTASWTSMMALITKLESKTKFKQGYVIPVFHTLLLNMGLQLFIDSELARSALKELQSCFERIESNKSSKKSKLKEGDVEGNEPAWLEVMVDLFLNLLSHNSHLLRSVIGCVFPHLCPHLTITALHQILDVLHSNNEDGNPLSKDDSDSDSDEEEEEGSDVEDEEKSDEESDSNAEEDADGEPETVSDKLRMAVRAALGKSGPTSDDESVDMDNMNEEEADKLDAALAEAFKAVKKPKINKNKQSKDDKTLTHFRVRVLDLIEMYLDSEPAMLHCLEIAIPLLHVLEFAIRDVHQKPLENRVRSCMKKLSAIKKFNNTDGVNDTILTEMLESFLDKGSKSAFIYQDMGDKISDCCLFVIRCSQILHPTESTPKKKKASKISEIINSSLVTFFKKRDCLLPIVLFKSVLQQNWEGIWSLVPLLVQFAFDEDIRPFRRSQALELLRIFYNNSRFITTNFDTFQKHIRPVEEELSGKSIELFKVLIENPKDCKVKEKFVCNLLQLLCLVKGMKGSENVDWETIGSSVREYRSRVTLAKDAKVAYNKLCRTLGIPNLVKMKSEQSVTETQEESDAEEQVETVQVERKKKSKIRSKETQKLKKEAQMLRLKASAEGLEDVNFSNVSLSAIKNEEPDVEDSDDSTSHKKSKKVKLNGVSQSNGIEGHESASPKKKRNNSESNDRPIKKKIKK